MYIVRRRPNGEVVARCKKYRDAVNTVAEFETFDFEREKFEPETYYINEVMDDE